MFHKRFRATNRCTAPTTCISSVIQPVINMAQLLLFIKTANFAMH
jgi:hypothetical protein